MKLQQVRGRPSYVAQDGFTFTLFKDCEHMCRDRIYIWSECSHLNLERATWDRITKTTHLYQYKATGSHNCLFILWLQHAQYLSHHSGSSTDLNQQPPHWALKTVMMLWMLRIIPSGREQLEPPANEGRGGEAEGTGGGTRGRGWRGGGWSRAEQAVKCDYSDAWKKSRLMSLIRGNKHVSGHDEKFVSNWSALTTCKHRTWIISFTQRSVFVSLNLIYYDDITSFYFGIPQIPPFVKTITKPLHN